MDVSFRDPRLFWLKSLSALVVLLFGTAFNLNAQQLSVAYLEGEVEMQSGVKWVQLSIGDEIPADSKLRLGEGSYIELRGASASFSFSQPGTYSLRELINASRKTETNKFNAAIVGVLQNLVTNHTVNLGAAAGARGANKSTQEQEDWMNSTAQVFLEAGKEFIESGEYAKAIDRFQKALSVASADEVPEIKYYLAYAYSLNGNTRDTFRQISEVRPTGEEDGPDYALLKAKFFLDTSAFNQAVEVLTAQSEVLQQDQQRATMYFFLLALGYRGIGDKENERKSLSRVISMSSARNIGHAASGANKRPVAQEEGKEYERNRETVQIARLGRSQCDSCSVSALSSFYRSPAARERAIFEQGYHCLWHRFTCSYWNHYGNQYRCDRSIWDDRDSVGCEFCYYGDFGQNGFNGSNQRCYSQ